ncbi:MAG: glycosyltransferase [Lewinellaceae bacterium]|nr:glycosyltransferase [Lewinellaceae bacterium]
MKVQLELPTWPYEAEFRGWRRWLLLPMDRLCRHFLPGLVDEVLHYGEETHIWGLPVKQVRNGIDPDLLPALPAHEPNPDCLQLLALGNWSEWHGLDRLLRGMQHAPNWNLTVAGAGPALARYRVLVRELSLETRVQFLPPVSGAELHALLASADLGVGTLGLHRKGVAINQSLKHRLYCLAGLPFFFASPDPSFPPDFPYTLQFAADETDVDMSAVSDFFWKMRQKNPAYREDLRDFAATLTPVLPQ